MCKSAGVSGLYSLVTKPCSDAVSLGAFSVTAEFACAVCAMLRSRSEIRWWCWSRCLGISGPEGWQVWTTKHYFRMDAKFTSNALILPANVCTISRLVDLTHVILQNQEVPASSLAGCLLRSTATLLSLPNKTPRVTPALSCLAAAEKLLPGCWHVPREQGIWGVSGTRTGVKQALVIQLNIATSHRSHKLTGSVLPHHLRCYMSVWGCGSPEHVSRALAGGSVLCKRWMYNCVNLSMSISLPIRVWSQGRIFLKRSS